MKHILVHSDRLLAQNSEAVLAVIVIWARDTVFAKDCQAVQKHILIHLKERDDVRNKVRDKVRSSKIYVLMKEDANIIPVNILSYHKGS